LIELTIVPQPKPVPDFTQFESLRHPLNAQWDYSQVGNIRLARTSRGLAVAGKMPLLTRTHAPDHLARHAIETKNLGPIAQTACFPLHNEMP
jgi:hypothetical protein